MEDRNNMSTCLDMEATKLFRKGTDEMKVILEELESEPTLQKTIICCLHLVQRGNNLDVTASGFTNYGDGLTLSQILRDQHRIGLINFFAGRRSVKWNEAQKRHYLKMDRKKSTKLWVVEILKKIVIIRWDLW